MTDLLADVLAHPMVGLVGVAVAASAVALWVAAAWWAHADAERRTGSQAAALAAAGWIVLSTPFLLPFSLAIYAMARPQLTVSEQRTRRLARELVVIGEDAGSSCPSCRAATDPGWLRCLACSAWLSAPCAGCDRWSDATLDVCPWCASASRADPAPALSGKVSGKMEPTPSRSRRTRPRTRAMGPGLPDAGRRPNRGTSQAPEARPVASLQGSR